MSITQSLRQMAATAGKITLLIAMLCVTIASAIGADETYYVENTDFFGTAGTVRVLDEHSTINTTFYANVTGENIITSLAELNGSLYAGTDTGKVVKSTDNGQTWVNTTLTGQDYVYDMAVYDGQLFIAAGSNEEVCNTTNGDNWSCVDAGASADWYAIATNTSHIYVSGINNRIASYSTDGGLSYSDCSFLTLNTAGFTELFLDSNNRLWVGSGNGNIYYSDDGCASWTSPVTPPDSIVVRKIVEDSNGDIHAGGVDATNLGAVWITTDYGVSWSKQFQFNPHAEVRALWTGDNSHMMAGTITDGRLFESYDYGATWSQVSGFSESGVYDIITDNDNFYIATGNSGRIYIGTPIPLINEYILNSDCGEFVDWDGDGYLDLVGFKINDSNSSVIWSILRNVGTNVYPSFEVIYNFTTAIRGTQEFGGECVATADLTDNGLLEIFTYVAQVPDSYNTEVLDDTINKSGYRAIWGNIGTALNPVFQFSGNSLLSLPYAEYTVVDNLQLTGLYQRVTGGIPIHIRTLSTLCLPCNAATCSSPNLCYGFYSFPTNPRVYYQFFDVDSDGDLDLFTSGDTDYAYWWENTGSVKIPAWNHTGKLFPYRAWSSGDYYRVVDFDSDGDPDYIGSPEGPLQGNLRIYLVESTGWDDPVYRTTITNRSHNASPPWDNSNTYEPLGYGYNSKVVYVGDYDGDIDQDIFRIDRRATGYVPIMYESQDVGDASGYQIVSEVCSPPCIYDEDFNQFPDNSQLNDLPEWTAPDCIRIDNGEIVIEGNCTTNRVCLELPRDITDVGTISYVIKATEECRYSSYHNGYLELSVLNAWDNISGNYVYHYIGDLLGRSQLVSTDPNSYEEYYSVVYIQNDTYDLYYNNYTGTLDMYAANQDITGISRLCWNAEDTAAVCTVDNIFVYQGIDPNAEILVVTDEYECYAGWCYLKEGIIGDARPDAYTPQVTDIGGAWFNYERCVEEGFRPNQLCIPRLLWLDGKTTLKNWFTANIVYIFIMFIIVLVIVIAFVRSRREP